MSAKSKSKLKENDSLEDLQADKNNVSVNEEVNEKEVVKEVSSEELIAQEKDKFLRLFAEFENYKRRTTKERLELYKTANQELMTVLIPILDDFDRAVLEISKSGDENLLKGIELIQVKLKATLKQKGLDEVTVEIGDSFDADVHEAITIIPAPSNDLKGKIVDIIEKGYKLGEKIIRFPKVITGQ
ncbi:MAG: nucleotide exchange factor GrpE [Bacteroidetes bacterium]|jgi:molecular chaperone GrpE|nr:nucleotide exchange factor GrpE [Bacteroidota bacterium]